MRLFILAALSTVIMAVPAIAATPCSGVDMQLTKQRKADFAKLIAQSFKAIIPNLDKKVKPSQIEIDKFMQLEKWTIVYASAPVADPGYFFFDSSSGKPIFKDVWGGVATKSEASEIEKWALELGANKLIATCFADTVTY